MQTQLMLCEIIVEMVIQMNIKTYSELVKFQTFDERFEYLKLNGEVGRDTFGFDRWINQTFYRSSIWKKLRDQIIIRDNGCDLGLNGFEIPRRIIIHHMNPITIRDIELQSDFLLNPDFLICTSHSTHNALHYSDEQLIIKEPVKRFKNDTCPWRR